jgi:phosphatidylserine decarboxylase
MPTDHRIHREWLKKTVQHVDNNEQQLVPVLQEFKELIEGNTRIFMLFNSMFEEIPVKKPYCKDPTGHKQIRDYYHMLQILNHILTTAPAWTDAAENVGMVGVPMNAIYDWPMGTARYEASNLHVGKRVC